MALLQRLYDFFAAPPADPGIALLYGACVTQSRQPEFYSVLGVPDTVDGRFDLLLLHVYLVMRELDEATEAKQKLFDLMFADMDRNLREMGVGDMSIGKKMKPMLAAFYGRAQSYERALAESDAELGMALRRNIYGKSEADPENLAALTYYVRRVAAKLEGQAVADILSGDVEFARVRA